MKSSQCHSILFFFFKQKTAYEMRISDWSSDVCSSDLLLHPEKRRRYLDRHWAEEWRRTAIAVARQHWAKYKDRPLQSESAARLNEIGRASCREGVCQYV